MRPRTRGGRSRCSGRSGRRTSRSGTASPRPSGSSPGCTPSGGWSRSATSPPTTPGTTSTTLHRSRGSSRQPARARPERDPSSELMKKHRIFTTAFASVYPHYVRKAEAKGRTREDVDEVICWLTGYSPEALAEQIERKKDFETFFSEAPALHPNASKITGVICGVRIERSEEHTSEL